MTTGVGTLLEVSHEAELREYRPKSQTAYLRICSASLDIERLFRCPQLDEDESYALLTARPYMIASRRYLAQAS